MEIQAQNLSTSSYSHYGIGEKLINNDIVIKSMAGISTAYGIPLSNGTNFSNPAANNKMRSSVFSLEGVYFWTKYSGNNAPKPGNTFYFSKISLGFPLNEKWRIALGYQPYSGYFHSLSKLSIPNKILKETQKIDDLKGSGGLNTVEGFVNYIINENFYLGINGSCLFGSLERSYEKKLPEDSSKFWKLDDKFKGLEIKLGALYSKVSKAGKRWAIGATYGIGTKSNVIRNFNSYETKVAKKNKELETNNSYSESNKILFFLPASFSLGFSYGVDSRWILSGQFDWSKNSELNSLKFFRTQGQEDYKNSQKFSLGGCWISKYNFYKNYFSKIIYRSGLYYENTGLFVSQESIKNYGITFGVSLPLKIKKELNEDSSYLNIGFELGQRGTNQKILLKETYTNLRVGFTFGSKWFKKRIYH